MIRVGIVLVGFEDEGEETLERIILLAGDFPGLRELSHQGIFDFVDDVTDIAVVMIEGSAVDIGLFGDIADTNGFEILLLR
jgi:hypothetical protein